ncbi:uncharacterized protein LOC143360421 isoform X1 [Halictus rubicundus]|uniref:uncharacterized protein LOC143360421 isoform X1 n=2 Tax=Halictini TaxID=88544 RepID=UPI004034FCB9
MQLAATQRPHPPPVPPRPSRQVVAEALKRSPRPPCPTRQAPPPPNTKPWRSDQEQQQQQQQQSIQQPTGQQQVCGSSNAGRTVVYESTSKESSKDQQETTEAVARVTDKDRGSVAARNASERNAEEEVEEEEKEEKEEQQHRQHRNPPEKYRPVDREHPGRSIEQQYGSKSCENAADRQVRAHGRENNEDPDSKKIKPRESKDQNADQSRRSPVERNNKWLENHERSEPAVSYKPTVLAKCNDEGRFGSAESRIDRAKERIAGSEKSDAEGRPTPTRRSCLAKNRDPPRKPTTNANPREDGPSVNDNIEPASNVDRATIVVIDEPERKAASDAVVGDVDEQNGTANENENENENDNIHRQDWLDAGVQYSSTQITLSGGDDSDRVNGLDRCENEKIGDLNLMSLQERIAMSSLQGLPPLPRSLSGFNLSGGGGRGEGCEPPPPPTRSSSKTQRGGKASIQSSSRPSPPARQLTTLDTQLAILRREMFGLRQLDLSLLSQLWSLNESIQEFRQLLQEQEDRAPSPSPSSEEGDDTSYGTHPPPPPRRAAPVAHHHRPPRPPRPARPPPSDDSPSSEEYGAV